MNRLDAVFSSKTYDMVDMNLQTLTLRCVNRIIIGVSLTFALFGPLSAAEPSFNVLSFTNGMPSDRFVTPRAVSADGTVVVGDCDLGDEAFRWTAADGINLLGFLPVEDVEDVDEMAGANGVSSDGSIVVGCNISDMYGYEAFWWTERRGVSRFQGASHRHRFLQANGISGDGSTIVGDGINWRRIPYVFEAVCWGRLLGLINLGQLPGGTQGASARGTSYDGSVIVGFSDSQASDSYHMEAFRWTARTGMIGLGDLPGGDFASIARSVSADGRVAVGESWIENGFEAFRWTQKGGMVGLGNLYQGDSIANAVSADGSRIVGVVCYYDEVIDDSRSVAFIWDAVHGMRDLNVVLADEYGLDLHGLDLAEATAISGDGSTIVGRTAGNLGYYGWIAYLPTPLDQLVTNVQELDLAERLKSGLLMNLRRTKQWIVTGHCRLAAQQMNTFLYKVSRFSRKGLLAQDSAATLTESANVVKSGLACLQ